MKTAEEWHHTPTYIRAQREANPNWMCKCESCKYVRSIQSDALREAARIALSKYEKGCGCEMCIGYTRAAKAIELRAKEVEEGKDSEENVCEICSFPIGKHEKLCTECKQL